jgi:hypothetical protein
MLKKLLTKKLADDPFEAFIAVESKPQAETGPTESESAAESRAFELLLYGNEQIIAGSDNGTLVAFAALAFQQIRGKGEFHQDIGCGLLLFSVLMCALVHLGIGNAYVGRARKLIRGGHDRFRHMVLRRSSLILAFTAATVQFLSILIGCYLILVSKPPPGVERVLRSLFG